MIAVDNRSGIRLDAVLDQGFGQITGRYAEALVTRGGVVGARILVREDNTGHRVPLVSEWPRKFS